MAAGFAVGFFGSCQDVATDGMAVDIIPVNQQAKANEADVPIIFAPHISPLAFAC